MIIFQSIYKPLLFLHFIFTIYLIGAVSHLANLLFLIINNKIKNEEWEKLKKVYIKLLISYLGAFFSGLLIYPVFRYYVRFLYMDKNFPLGTLLFELKEHFLALGLLISIVSYFLLLVDECLQDVFLRRMFIITNMFLIIMVIYALIVGFYLVTVKVI